MRRSLSPSILPKQFPSLSLFEKISLDAPQNLLAASQAINSLEYNFLSLLSPPYTGHSQFLFSLLVDMQMEDATIKSQLFPSLFAGDILNFDSSQQAELFCYLLRLKNLFLSDFNLKKVTLKDRYGICSYLKRQIMQQIWVLCYYQLKKLVSFLKVVLVVDFFTLPSPYFSTRDLLQ